MDPASIIGLVAACASLTKQCASVVKSLHGLIETYKSAELIILSVVTECETIQFAWCRIESWAQEQLHHIDDFEDVGARLQKSIYCGELVMSALEEELLSITSRSGSVGRGVGITWNNSVLNEHQHRIRGQVAALQLLLQVLNLPRKEDRIEVLSVKESVFSESDESALSIVPSDRSTRFSLDGNRLSIISDDGDIQYIRFSFEDALFTSHVYKRNYRFPTKRTNTNNQPELAAQEESPSPTATKDSETDIDVLTVNEHDEGDEEFFQDEMTQFHHDLFAGEVLEDTVSQPGSSELGDDASRDSDSDTSDTPSIVPWGSGTDEEGVQREQELKKTLSRALQKANTAVLLDNAQNFAGALEAYQEASRLLRRVMIRAKTEEDRRKLDAIRKTYRNRMVELTEVILVESKVEASVDIATEKRVSAIRIGAAI